jgi:PAS domain S-box-containing protein
MTEPAATTELGGPTKQGEFALGPHEYLFSTTDRSGRITACNDLFARISGYSRSELIGASHNLVRNPDTPSGVFHLIWQGLLAGRPMAAYVKNQTKDGAPYWDFETIAPLKQGFVSVRMAPRAPLAEAAKGLYAAMSSFERERAARRQQPRGQLAAEGAAHFERSLAQVGFDSYDDFMQAAVTGEITARSRLLGSGFARPLASGSPGEILRVAKSLDDELSALMRHLDDYATLTSELTAAATTVLETAQRLQVSVTSATVASAEVAAQAPVLRNVAAVMATPMSSAVSALTTLAPQLGALLTDVAQLGSQVALARLHTEMIGVFATEVIDSLASFGSLSEVTPLCEAVADGVAAMEVASASINDRLNEMAARVRETSRLLSDFRHFLGEWRILVMRRRMGANLADYLQPIDEEYEAAADQLEDLQNLARRCQGAVVPFDRAQYAQLLERIRTAVPSSRL